MMKPTQTKFLVTLVRHGETFMNVQRVMQGHSDVPLSQVGTEQATKLGKYLNPREKFTKAYSSDLQRAYKTASLILNESVNAPPLLKNLKLRERRYGDAEGKPFKEFAERAEKANVSIHDFVPTGAETPVELRKRVADFFDELCELSKTTTGDENILVVSHGGWIQSLLRHLHESTDTYLLKNFTTNSIRIHHNTGTTVMQISPICNTSKDNLKYEIEFIQMNNTDHLN